MFGKPKKEHVKSPSVVFGHRAAKSGEVKKGEWFALDLPVIVGERTVWDATVVSGSGMAYPLKREFLKRSERPSEYGDLLRQRLTRETKNFAIKII